MSDGNVFATHAAEAKARLPEGYRDAESSRPVVSGLNGSNVLTHVAQLEVKDGQGLIQVIYQTDAIIQASLHSLHQGTTLQDSMHIGCLQATLPHQHSYCI